MLRIYTDVNIRHLFRFLAEFCFILTCIFKFYELPKADSELKKKTHELYSKHGPQIQICIKEVRHGEIISEFLKLEAEICTSLQEVKEQRAFLSMITSRGNFLA